MVAVLAAHSRDAADTLSWWDAASAARLGTVTGLGTGSVAGMTGRPEGGREAWIGYTDHVTPPMVWRWTADDPTAVTPWALPI